MDRAISDRPTSLLRHALTYGLGAISLQLAGIALIPLYTHYLPPSDYGVLQLVYRVGTVLHICLMIQGIKLATLNLAGQSPLEFHREKTAASVTVIAVSSLIMGSAAILAAGDWLSEFLGIDDAHLLKCGVLVVMLQATTIMPLAMMQTRYESTSYVLVTGGIAIMHVFLAVITVAGLGLGVWGVIGGLALVNGSFGAVLTWRELRRGSLVPEWRQVRHVIRFSLPLIPVGLLAVLMHNGDQFFLMKSHGAEAVGIYALAYRLVQTVEVFATEPLCQVWQPWMYSAYQRSDGSVLMGRAATRILAVYTFAALGVILLRQELLSVLCSEAYLGAARVIPPLAVAFLFVVASSLCDASFYVTSRTNLRALIAALSAGTFVALYALLIPSYGALGAAYATVAGFAVNALITFVLAQRVYRVRYEAGRVAAMMGLAALVVGSSALVGDGPIPAVVKFVAWMMWPASLWLLGVVSREEKAYVAELLRELPRRLETAWSEISGGRNR